MRASSGVAAKVIRATAGVVLLIIGVIGLFMPVLPGWIFIVPGLALLARDFAWAERLHASVRHRISRARHAFENRNADDAERDAA